MLIMLVFLSLQWLVNCVIYLLIMPMVVVMLLLFIIASVSSYRVQIKILSKSSSRRFIPC